MTRFFNWLKTPPSSYLLLILNGTLIALAYMVMHDRLEMYGIVPSVGDWQDTDAMSPKEYLNFILVTILSTPVAVPVEELLFRAPLSLLRRQNHRIVVFCSLLLAGMFGYVHGGLPTIPAQEVVGLLFSLIYLKAGGSTGKFIRPVMTSSAVHALYNLYILIPAAITAALAL